MGILSIFRKIFGIIVVHIVSFATYGIIMYFYKCNDVFSCVDLNDFFISCYTNPVVFLLAIGVFIVCYLLYII